jgi:hypothetical protein
MLSPPCRTCQEPNRISVGRRVARTYLPSNKGGIRRLAKLKTPDQNSGLELEIRTGPSRGRAISPCRRQQRLRCSVEGFPRRLGQCRLRAYHIPDHLPCRQIQRSLRRWSHRERHRALRAKTDSTRRRFLPRTNPCGLRKQKYGNRLFPSFEFPITAKTILTIQPAHSDRYVSLAHLSLVTRPGTHCHLLSRMPGQTSKYAERFRPFRVTHFVPCPGNHRSGNQVLI